MCISLTALDLGLWIDVCRPFLCSKHAPQRGFVKSTGEGRWNGRAEVAFLRVFSGAAEAVRSCVCVQTVTRLGRRYICVQTSFRHERQWQIEV